MQNPLGKTQRGPIIRKSRGICRSPKGIFQIPAGDLGKPPVFFQKTPLIFAMPSINLFLSLEFSPGLFAGFMDFHVFLSCWNQTLALQPRLMFELTQYESLKLYYQLSNECLKQSVVVVLKRVSESMKSATVHTVTCSSSIVKHVHGSGWRDVEWRFWM